MPKVSKQSHPAPVHLYNCGASLRRPTKSLSESNLLSDLGPRRFTCTANDMSPQKRKVSFESCSSSTSPPLASPSDACLSHEPIKRSLVGATLDERCPTSSSCEIKKPRLSRSFCLKSLVEADDSNSHSTSGNDTSILIQPSQSLSSCRHQSRDDYLSVQSLPISATNTDSLPISSSWGHFVDVIPVDQDDVRSSNPYGWKSSSRSFSRYSPYQNQCWLSSSKKGAHTTNFKTSNTNNDGGISAALRKIQI